MNLLKFNYGLLTVIRSIVKVYSVFIICLQNVGPAYSFTNNGGGSNFGRSGVVSLAGVERLSLVIFLSVNSYVSTPIQAATVIRDEKQRQIEASAEYSDEIKVVRVKPSVLRRRFSRQMSFIAPALQTMGCLPKFFCLLNSKKPTETSSSLNDLAYLIKFAMVDEDLDDSEEKKAKDDLNSESDSEDEHKKRQTQKFEHLADEKLIQEDPEYLNFIWKDMKNKIKHKFKDGKMDEQVLNQMLSDMEAESNANKAPSSSYKAPGLFSGLKNLVRFGRSVNDDDHQYPKRHYKFHNITHHRSRETRRFWDTEEFDEQMKLAARIGQASPNTDKQCTSTFNLCPYTAQEMKRMVGGKDDDIPSENPETWYDNSQGPRKPHSTTPNPLSHAIYLLNPTSLDGQKPSAASPLPQQPILFKNKPRPYPLQRPTSTTTTTRAPKPRPRPTTTTTTTIKPKPQRQQGPVKVREPEDDESGFDNPVVNYADNILPSSRVKVVKINNNKNAEDEEESEEEEDDNTKIGPTTSSEEEESDKPLKIPPKFKSTATVKVTKIQKPTKMKFSPTKTKLPLLGPKRQKNTIGIPRPKYTIKHKYRNRPLSTEQGMDKLQGKKKQAIASSEEKYSKENHSKQSEEEESNESSSKTKKKESEEEKPSSEEKIPVEIKIAEKLRINSRQPQKYKLKQRPKDKLEFKKVDDPSDESLEDKEDDEEQKNKRTELEKSSEEEKGNNNNKKHKKHKNSDASSEEEKHKDGQKITNKRSEEEEEDSHEQSQHPKPSLHPIKYSYYNKDNVDEEGENNDENSRPNPTTTTAGGLLSSLFGGGNKKKQQQNQLHHSPPGSTSGSESESQNSSAEDGQMVEEAAAKEEDSSEENNMKTKSSTSSPKTTTVPPPTSTSTEPEPQKSKKDENRPIIVDPDAVVTTPKYPSLPRFPQPSRKKTISSTTPTPSSSSTTKDKSRKDGEDDDEYADSSESKEAQDKTAESKESSEEDPNHVKNIFSKASISSLGKVSENNEKRNKISPPPPPPPISNWKPTNNNETRINFKNISKSPNALATLSTPTIVPSKQKMTEDASDEKEDDSVEEIVQEIEYEYQDSSEEAEEDDVNKKKKNKGPTDDDDEAENREPFIKPVEDFIPQLGVDVVSLGSNNKFPSSGSSSPLPAPALAPVSNFDKDNEIKVPMTEPLKPNTNSKNKRVRVPAKNTGDDDATVVKTAPNAAGPASPPGGGLPSGGLPSGGAPNSGASPNSGGSPNSGRLPGGGNRRPGGGNRMPGSGNRMPGSGNRMPGNNAGTGGEGESSEEKSEEEIGKSSEENNKTSEEEEEEENGRSGLNKKKTASSRKVDNETEKDETAITEDKKDQIINNKPSIIDPTLYDTPHKYPALPPIYKWKPQNPTLMTRLMKPKTVKPTPTLPKPSTTKDTFYSKPLSPMLVQYLRETYGNSYLSPPKNRIRAPFTTLRTTTSEPKTKKKWSTNSFKNTFEHAKLGNIKNGNQASDVIHFDEFEHVDNNDFNHRMGTPLNNKKVSQKPKTNNNLRIKSSVPPIYGKITFHG